MSLALHMKSIPKDTYQALGVTDWLPKKKVEAIKWDEKPTKAKYKNNLQIISLSARLPKRKVVYSFGVAHGSSHSQNGLKFLLVL